jgi:hypothetical protein
MNYRIFSPQDWPVERILEHIRFVDPDFARRIRKIYALEGKVNVFNEKSSFEDKLYGLKIHRS